MDQKGARRLADLTADLMMTFGRMTRAARQENERYVNLGAEFGILDTLLRHGCRTVPEIAVRRGVARQSVQAVVNKLLETGALEQSENSDHKSSKLLTATPLGIRQYEFAQGKIQARYARMDGPLRDGDIDAALRVLTLLAETWSPDISD